MTKFTSIYQPNTRGRKNLGEKKRVSLQVYVQRRTKEFFLAHKGLASAILDEYAARNTEE